MKKIDSSLGLPEFLWAQKGKEASIKQKIVEQQEDCEEQECQLQEEVEQKFKKQE